MIQISETNFLLIGYYIYMVYMVSLLSQSSLYVELKLKYKQFYKEILN